MTAKFCHVDLNSSNPKLADEELFCKFWGKFERCGWL